ncbi:WD repeat-containing protein 76 [Cyanidiococcus yangmingshanensis]|uniref:WD repeat-containing protein 76 n=1 Tax=Cyanidiococcus yangmingshanensis TaxID=2690220 RepID=A0A7J7IPQ8_9RHOD|nr:WD repeat-containing protein 76 [Cyanidiococcus yangmingshanensis]
MIRENIDEEERFGHSVGAYERERFARIERNRALMEKLGVAPLSQRLETFMPARPSSSKPAGHLKRPRKVDSVASQLETGAEPVTATPRRRSLRVRGIAPEGTEQGATGSTLMNASAEEDQKPTGPILEDQRFAELTLPDYGADLDPSDEDTGVGDIDDSSLRLRRVRAFRRAWDDLSSTSAAISTRDSSMDAERFKSWTLDEKTGFLKLVPARIYSGVMFPRTDAWTIAVGDKAGHVGIAITSFDLRDTLPVHVLSMRVHRDTTAGLAVLSHGPCARRLLSVSYDGSARVLDLEKEMVETVLADNQERILKTVVPSSLNEDVFWTTASHRSLGGFIMRHDLRQDQKSFDVFRIADCRVYSIDLQYGRTSSTAVGHEGLLAVTTAREGVLVFDPRRMEGGAIRRAAPKPLYTLPHTRAVTGANWSPSGTRLLTTCYDDLLRVWRHDGNDFPLEHRFVHNNHTGRWVTPFDAQWDPTTDHKLFACGSMNHNPEHGVDLFNTEVTRRTVWQRLTGEPMTAIAAVLAWHPAGVALAGCTASGRVYLWGESNGLEEERLL